MSEGQTGKGLYGKIAAWLELKSLCQLYEVTVSEGFVGSHVKVAEKVADCH